MNGLSAISRRQGFRGGLIKICQPMKSVKLVLVSISFTERHHDPEKFRCFSPSLNCRIWIRSFDLEERSWNSTGAENIPGSRSGARNNILFLFSEAVIIPRAGRLSAHRVYLPNSDSNCPLCTKADFSRYPSQSLALIPHPNPIRFCRHSDWSRGNILLINVCALRTAWRLRCPGNLESARSLYLSSR